MKDQGCGLLLYGPRISLRGFPFCGSVGSALSPYVRVHFRGAYDTCYDRASSDDSFVSFVYVPVHLECWPRAFVVVVSSCCGFGRVRCGGIALVGLALRLNVRTA